MRRLPVLACVVLVVAGCSSGATKSSGSGTTLPGDTTTSVGVAATSASETTAPATTFVAPTTTHPEGGFGEPFPAATAPSAWVAGTQEGDPEVSAEPGVCAPFYDAIAGGAYTVQECGIWNAIGGQRMWTVTRGSTGRFFAIIWQQSAPNTWVPMMRSQEEAAGVWDAFTIVTGNIDSGANDELVSGIRVAGSGGYLSIDIVDIRSGNPRTMAVYNELAHGIAVLAPSVGVQVFVAQYGAADPDCCPSAYQRLTIYSAGGAWLVVPGPVLAIGDPGIPVSAF